MKKKTIAILGSTGSIGQSTLEIVRKTKKFNVKLLIANKNYLKIEEQIKFFKPSIFIINNKNIYYKIKKKYGKRIIILNNTYNIEKYVKKLDIAVSAIPGIAGLEPTIQFTKISKKILLDNNNYPIDLIEKIFITASGGPFLNLKINKFKNIKSKDAIKHPKWKMGKKISVDSATLMNKVLEITEALKLFPFRLDQYKIIIHPDSLVHAVIRLKNGTSILLYHFPDMKIPIGNALLKNFNYKKLFVQKNKSYKKIHSLNFSQVDKKRFPSVNLIPEMNSKKATPIIVNAANEIFVDEFLKNNISFNDIVNNLKLVLKDKSYIKTSKLSVSSLKNIFAIDNWARKAALKILERKR